MDGELDGLYADLGRVSIPPERLLRASLLQTLFSIRSERQLVAHIDYNLLYRWFVGLGMNEEVWNHSTFSANRDRLLNEAVARLFFRKVLALAEWQGLVSDKHFLVDGTLIEAWASMKSFVKKDGTMPPPEGGGRNPTVVFKGETRSNDTHQSTTDPDARLYKKSEGDKSRLCYLATPQVFLLSDTTRATTDNTEKMISAVSSRTIIEVGSPSRKMPSSRPSAAHESTSRDASKPGRSAPMCAQ